MTYANKVVSLLTDLKTWALSIIGIVTVCVIIWHGLQYQQGNASDKTEAISSIKKTLYMGGGIFFLVWLATYVITKMK